MTSRFVLSNSYTHSSEELAVRGGAPIRTSPFPRWPYFCQADIEATAEVLRSGRINYWTGDQGKLFEQEFAAYCGCKYAVAVANGTVALELALLGLGIGPGDEVIVPSRTFIASGTCVVMRGAIPVFADVDRGSQTLTAGSVANVLSPRTRAIIAVHLAGWPCDMDEITDLARKHSLYVIEDCAQAHGATYRGKRVGSLGDAAAFSFCQDKIISTGGEGGMLVTGNPKVWERAWMFKDHGRNYSLSHAKGGLGFRWIHETFGSNYRLTEIQSTLGRIQLCRLEEQLAARRHNAEILTRCLKEVPGLRLTEPPAHIGHAFYKYYAFINPQAVAPGWSRDHILEAIVAEGIPCASGSCSEIYLENCFPERWRPRNRLPVAQELGENSLMFMVHPTLSDDDMLDAGRAVSKVMNAAAKHTTSLVA